jgi:hypothetical protein
MMVTAVASPSRSRAGIGHFGVASRSLSMTLNAQCLAKLTQMPSVVDNRLWKWTPCSEAGGAPHARARPSDDVGVGGVNRRPN